MKKILTLILLSFFMICCSNNYVQENFTDSEIRKLYIFEDELKENLAINNYNFLEKNVVNKYKNKYILDKIKDIDFSNFNIFLSKPLFKKNIANSILALNINENTFYFTIIFVYDYHDKRWLIDEIEERR